jgi:NlpC/P60 family putative phage cell wall peptidase
MATDGAKIVAAARDWIGTPYVHQASLKGKGCDCLGLLRGVWREVKGEDDPEILPPYSPDWAEAKGAETLYIGLKRHLTEIAVGNVTAGNVALFRMIAHGPAKHCGIVAEKDGTLTLIHARQNKRVSEEVFSAAWRAKLAFAFEVP